MDLQSTRARSDVDDLSPQDVFSEFLERDLPRHLALFYESVDTQLAVCAAFAKRELQRGRQFLYLYEDNDEAAIRAALRSVDIDVAERLADRDVRIEDAGNVYLEEGFDPEQMIGELERAARAAVDDGYEGLSVAGENTWCFHTTYSFDRIVGFESDFDARAPDLPVTALCQYDLDRFDPESISKALWTHEQIIYRGQLCENPFYIPPAEFQSIESEASQFDARLMLEQTYSLSQARRDLSNREQRIDVLNRTLRHNIRNEINVILGYLREILSDGALTPEDRERVEIARRYAENISRTSEKARFVQQTLSKEELQPTDLGPTVREAVDVARSRYPDATIDVSVADSPTLLADRNLRRAVEELLENAIHHQNRTPAEVGVTVESRSDTVVIDVSNPGPPIPEDDQRALREGRETSLRHGRGLGLWMVKWVAENSHGWVRFPQREDECRVRIELPRTAAS